MALGIMCVAVAKKKKFTGIPKMSFKIKDEIGTIVSHVYISSLRLHHFNQI